MNIIKGVRRLSWPTSTLLWCANLTPCSTTVTATRCVAVLQYVCSLLWFYDTSYLDSKRHYVSCRVLPCVAVCYGCSLPRTLTAKRQYLLYSVLPCVALYSKWACICGQFVSVYLCVCVCGCGVCVCVCVQMSYNSSDFVDIYI